MTAEKFEALARKIATMPFVLTRDQFREQALALLADLDDDRERSAVMDRVGEILRERTVN